MSDPTRSNEQMAKTAVAGSHDRKLRVLGALLVLALLACLVTAIVAVYIALDKRQEAADRGTAFATQVETICNEEGRVKPENRFLCRNADKVIEGAQGIQGIPGVQGAQGDQGLEGPPGLEGPLGPQGTQGSQGASGPAGADGRNGLDGLDGQTGAPGEPGEPGQRGALGPAGQDGAQGATGPQGPSGPQGPPGPQGPRGEDGDDGVMTRITVAPSCQPEPGFYISAVRVAGNPADGYTFECSTAADQTTIGGR